MMNYVEQNEAVEVPKGTGIEGFMRAIREVLQLPRVQEIHVDARGKVSYKYFLREGETPSELKVEFDSLMPYAIVRNGLVVEVQPRAGADNAAVILGQMFARAAIDHVYPVAWVAGANTIFWRWFDESTGQASLVHDELFGLPFVRDRMVEDPVLLLCTAYGRYASIVDTQRSYKLLME
jgi:hypothetical protein